MPYSISKPIRFMLLLICICAIGINNAVANPETALEDYVNICVERDQADPAAAGSEIRMSDYSVVPTDMTMSRISTIFGIE